MLFVPLCSVVPSALPPPIQEQESFISSRERLVVGKVQSYYQVYLISDHEGLPQEIT